jgi:2-polyprenyl-3-methyl-5-hydroxy-6-metoxy-1,4-benzoquinol methylase
MPGWAACPLSLSTPPGPADQAVANPYDRVAEAYAAETESNLINGYYTRPAILDLAGEVAGRRILDVGCGAGPSSRRCASAARRHRRRLQHHDARRCQPIARISIT